MTRRRVLTALLLVATAVSATSTALTASESHAAKPGGKFGARVLKMGVRGKDVRVLQRSLVTLGLRAPVNGLFGKSTRGAVRKLEKKQRWPVNGVVSRGDAARIKKLLAQRKQTVFYPYGGIAPSVSVVAAQAGSGQVEVVDANTGLVVASLPVTTTEGGPVAVSWGLTTSSGWAHDSTYVFRIDQPGSAGLSFASAAKAFLVRAYAFPLPGKHNFGGKAARFGAPRSGHTHQGHDVLGACGLPLLAAQGGRVKVVAYQAGGAGYYVVITSAINGTDTVYMHLSQPSFLVEGQTIYTGQGLGNVGQTGAASGCHLHFEHWTAPGWYSGGSPYNPLAELKYWDSYS
jgi:peptidoglycan hydrolase-like protein with peptidoglycan-binding domain